MKQWMRLVTGFFMAAWCSNGLLADASAEREVVAGIKTTRPIPGQPYELAGNRLVFTNWYYIDPGDLDWRDAEGKSVYVKGDIDPFEAHHTGKQAPRGIRLVASKPKVIGPIELPHRSILQDGKIYKGWTDHEYLESTDGRKWEKKANLIFKNPAQEPSGVWDVFIDPSAPPEERFKTVWTDEITRKEFDAYRAKRGDAWEPRALLHLGENDQISCIRGSTSPDGITWNMLPEPLVVEYSDTFNTCYYDAILKKYVLYTRQWSAGPIASTVKPDIRNSWTGIGRRAIGRSDSSDFKSFPPSEMILEPTPQMLPSEVLYTNAHVTIPGAPDQHLMFPAIWNASIDDTTRIAMASSHDGRLWHWVPGGDILETQPFGQWNGGCIWALPSMIELPNKDFALLYLAHNVPHKYPRGKKVDGIGYALWPKGRMVAIHAEDHGNFTLIRMIAPGKTLKINAITKRAGSIKVAVLGKDGRTLEDCVPIVGDQAWTTVRWKDHDDLGVDRGEPVTLRFELSQADLFGLEFE